MTRIVIHFKDLDKVVKEISGIETEYFEGSGNLHIIDDNIQQVGKLENGSVLVEYDDKGKVWLELESADIVTVYPNE